MGILQTGRAWARRIKRDVMALWFARNHPRTPWQAKALTLLVVAWALSPIDLIPDFIPVLGYLDDVILLPVLVWLAVRLLPQDVLAQCRQQAEDWAARGNKRPASAIGAILVVALWIALGSLLLWWWQRR